MPRRGVHALAVTGLSFALLFGAACSDDDGDDGDTNTSTTFTVPEDESSTTVPPDPGGNSGGGNVGGVGTGDADVESNSANDEAPETGDGG